MSTTDELTENSKAYAEGFDKGELPLPPAKKVAVVACMDARLIPTRVLGLEEGDAHVIRNAGGVVTDDEIRSLAISQHLLGTEEIILIHHTDCGMLTFTDDEFRSRLQEETGIRPEWAAEAFSDLDQMSASASGASKQALSSRARTCAVSSTTSRPGSSAKCRLKPSCAT
jgi:carbonic anhydrase